MDFPLIWAAETASTGWLEWLSHAPTVIWNVLLVLIGVNLLIIVHEFGHFIVARMCGVRCDKFYIWFDIYGWKIFKFKWGDTEYGLGVLPLGGYVKMLGQEDNPGAIKAEIERAKAAEANAKNAETSDSPAAEGDKNAGENVASDKPEDKTDQPPAPQYTPEQLEEMLYAKDSYLSKSVPQRLAIITAGVFMNVVFAFVCACGAYLWGVPETPSVIGNAVAGSNAWKAGLQPGDCITAIDDRPVTQFDEISRAIFRTSKPESDFVIERSNAAEPIEVKIAPLKAKNHPVATIGVTPPLENKLAKIPFYPWVKKTDEMKQLTGQETLIAVNGEKIEDYQDVRQLQDKWRTIPLTYTFRKHKSDETVDVTLEPVAMPTLGVMFKPDKITALRENGKRFGFEEGDLLMTLDGEEIDPLKFPTQVYDKSQNGGGTIEIVVDRNGERKTIAVDVPADQDEAHLDLDTVSREMGSNILGIAYGVSRETAAEFLDVPAGATLEKITVLGEEMPKFLLESDLGKTVQDGYEISASEDLPHYVILLYGRVFPRLDEKTKLRLTMKSGNAITEKEITLEKDGQWLRPERGLLFNVMSFHVQAKSLGQALQLGGKRVVKDSLLIYNTVCQLVRNVNGTSRVSMKGLGGPITIVQQAYLIAGAGFGVYLLFLCLLSANLAVLNILPIPVLDGGHVVFLLYEAIFRKPPNETVQVILSYIGLLLLLALMVWVFALDLGFIKRF